MKKGLFSRLAVQGIKNNKQIYIPYILSCVGMVAMYFIVESVKVSPMLKKISGGDVLAEFLSLGIFIIAFFALIFLIYTNSFLVKRRFKEFGLYNVLGMDKKGIRKIVAIESLIVMVIGIVGGMIAGIIFSKLAEFGLAKLVGENVTFSFYISTEAIFYTLMVFVPIFLILMIKALIQVNASKPLELLKNENVGEKPPKANWVIAILGAIILAVAYYLAIVISNPSDALFVFFIAVILVIIATYMLFVSGSVALCRLLQKKKKYYYKKNHFVSVSSMTYRMKRNGAGLASICILATMVLVMFSMTCTLYFGQEDSLKKQFPYDCMHNVSFLDVDSLQGRDVQELKNDIDQKFKEDKVEPQDLIFRKDITVFAAKTDKCYEPDITKVDLKYQNMLYRLRFIDVDTYNEISGSNYSLNDNEVLTACRRGKALDKEVNKIEYSDEQIKICGLTFDVKESVDDFEEWNGNTFELPTLSFIVSSLDILRPFQEIEDQYGAPMFDIELFIGYDLDEEDEKIVDVFNDIDNVINKNNKMGYSWTRSECVIYAREDFVMTYGGLFFISIILGIIFIFATAMIIYYKQISEGYEDQKRFEIMQKVGMTKKDIKKSINSQMLTVFLVPLIAAGVHLGFGFHLIWQILTMFGITNLWYVILVAAIVFVIFAGVYAIIYKITTKSYYNIVSKM